MGALFFLVGIILVFLWLGVLGIRRLRKKKAQFKSEFGTLLGLRSPQDTVSKYWEEFSLKNPQYNHVDATTWADLDMDAVFKRINRCQSSVGEEFLYAALHAPTDQENLQYSERLYKLFQEDETLRIAAQIELEKLGLSRNNGLWLLMFYPDLFTLKNPWRYTVQALLPLLGIPLLFLNLNVGIGFLVITLLLNFATFFWVQHKTEHELECISYLINVIQCAKKLQKKLKVVSPELSQALDKSVSRFKKLSLSSFLLSVSPNSEAATLISFIGMLTLIPVINYCKAVKLLIADRSMVQDLFLSVGAIDAAISVASFRASLPYFVHPHFSEELSLEGEDLFHPLLSEPVANGVAITKNLLLTGSNASGKSTYIKAVAINALLAQTLNTCCARAYSLKPAPVITSMGVADNIVGGESYFVVEIKSMKRLVIAAEEGWEFYGFIDEILKGTNTTERIAASATVLRFLYAKNCICVAATHDLELTEMLSSEYLNKHFSEQLTDEGMLFDYKLKEGPSQSKNAIKLLSYYEYPKEIVIAANALVETLEDQR